MKVITEQKANKKSTENKSNFQKNDEYLCLIDRATKFSIGTMKYDMTWEGSQRLATYVPLFPAFY